MSTRFAPTSHEAGPDDGLLVKDVYSESGIGPSNNGSYNGAAGDAASANSGSGLGDAAKNNVEAAALAILAAILAMIFGSDGGSSKNPGMASMMGNSGAGSNSFKPGGSNNFIGGASGSGNEPGAATKPALISDGGRGPTGAAGSNRASNNARSNTSSADNSGALSIVNAIGSAKNPSQPRQPSANTGGNISNSNFGGHGNLEGQVKGNNKDKGKVSSVVTPGGEDGIGKKVTTNKGLTESITGGNTGIAGGDTGAVVNLTTKKKDPAKEIKDPISVIDQFDTKQSVDLPSLIESLSNGNDSVLSGLTQLPDTVKDNLTGGFTQEQISGGDLLVDIKDKVTQVRPGTDPSVVKPIIQVIEAITKDTEAIKDQEGNDTGLTQEVVKVPAALNNKTGQAALIAGLTYLGTKVGLPDMFNTLSSTIDDKRVLLTAATVLARKAVDVGDKDLFQQLGKSSVAKEVASIIPEIAQIASGRIIPYDTLPQQEYVNFYQSVRQSLDSIDPSWQYYRRQDGAELTGNPIYAYEIHTNLFLHETMKATLNMLLNPANILAYYQSVYDTATPLDSEAVQYVKKKLEDTRTHGGGKIDPSKLVIENPEWSDTGNSVGIRTMTIEYLTDGADASGAQVQVKRTMSFANEPFFILSQVFADESSVDAVVKRDFPEFYKTLDKPIAPCSPKASTSV